MTLLRRIPSGRSPLALALGCGVFLLLAASIMALAPDGGETETTGQEESAETSGRPVFHFEVRLAAYSPVEGWASTSKSFEGKSVYLFPHSELSNADIADAWYDPSGGKHSVGLLLTEEGALKLAKLTKQHVGGYLALMLDGQIVSVPRIAAPITGGRALIEGNLTEEKARAVADGIVSRGKDLGKE